MEHLGQKRDKLEAEHNRNPQFNKMPQRDLKKSEIAAEQMRKRVEHERKIESELAKLLQLMQREERDVSRGSYYSYEYESLQSNSQRQETMPETTSQKRALPQDDSEDGIPRSFGPGLQRKRVRIDDPSIFMGGIQPPIPLMNLPLMNMLPNLRMSLYNPGTPGIKWEYPTMESIIPVIVFKRLPPSCQKRLTEIDMSICGAVDLVKGIAELGARFGKTATETELLIGYEKMQEDAMTSVLFNALSSEVKHILFWQWIQEATGKKPPEVPERYQTIKLKTPLAPVVDTRLRTHLVKQIDAKGPGALDERVRKWMDNIIASQ